MFWQGVKAFKRFERVLIGVYEDFAGISRVLKGLKRVSGPQCFAG